MAACRLKAPASWHALTAPSKRATSLSSRGSGVSTMTRMRTVRHARERPDCFRIGGFQARLASIELEPVAKIEEIRVWIGGARRPDFEPKAAGAPPRPTKPPSAASAVFRDSRNGAQPAAATISSLRVIAKRVYTVQRLSGARRWQTCKPFGEDSSLSSAWRPRENAGSECLCRRERARAEFGTPSGGHTDGRRGSLAGCAGTASAGAGRPWRARRGNSDFLGLGAAPDAAAAERGGKLYQPNCAFCHGERATGADGPDLVRSTVVLHDEKGDLIGLCY